MIPLLFALLSGTSSSLPAEPAREDPAAELRKLCAKDDRDGCAALWRARPASAFPAIVAELDAALALREGGRAEDAEGASAREASALWGARVAQEVLAAPLLADLAAARAGWTETDRRLFHEERAVHQKAMAWIEKGENRFGLEAALETTTRAIALGDWQGAAMGYQATAIAHQALSSFDDALTAWTQARRTYRDLALPAEELACQRAVVDMCYATERFSRGREAADQAAALARSLGDKKSEAALLERRAGFEEKLGLRQAAEATRAAAKTLGN